MRGMPSWSQKNRGENISKGLLHSEFFGVGWDTMPPLHWFLLCLRFIMIQPGFVHGHQSLQENIWMAPKKSKICSDWHLWHFWSVFRHFGTHFAESFSISKSSWMMDPTRSREMLSCLAIDLDEIRRTSKISLWIWSIISVLGRPVRDA